jgi:PhzF family phenazine biosynthesis protein
MARTQPIHQVDAFAEHPFAGNPAGVCVLQAPAPEAWMQDVAREMNLSETAFLQAEGDGWRLRWFTPQVEVELCGHATLAAAHTLWETGALAPEAEARFFTRSGVLTAARRGAWIEMDFPAKPVEPVVPPAGLLAALGLGGGGAGPSPAPLCVGRSQFDFLVEVESEAIVRRAAPDFGRLRQAPVRGTILTSRADAGSGFDFVSRFFAPAVGIDEDPVTGSAHCALAPYWAARLGRRTLVAYQASARGGVLRLALEGDRVRIAGRAVTVLRGELLAPPPATAARPDAR